MLYSQQVLALQSTTVSVESIHTDAANTRREYSQTFAVFTKHLLNHASKVEEKS